MACLDAHVPISQITYVGVGWGEIYATHFNIYELRWIHGHPNKVKCVFGMICLLLLHDVI